MARQKNEPCPSLNTITGRGYRLGIFSASDRYTDSDRYTEKDLAAVTMDSIPRCDPHCDPRNAAGLTDSNESFCLKCGAPVKNR